MKSPLMCFFVLGVMGAVAPAFSQAPPQRQAQVVSPEIRVDVHSSQFHCPVARWLEPEHASDLLAVDGDPEAALPL